MSCSNRSQEIRSAMGGVVVVLGGPVISIIGWLVDPHL